jgi:hypothetical protein
MGGYPVVWAGKWELRRSYRQVLSFRGPVGDSRIQGVGAPSRHPANQRAIFSAPPVSRVHLQQDADMYRAGLCRLPTKVALSTQQVPWLLNPQEPTSRPEQ